MHFLASFVMQGRGQAVVITATIAMLAFWLPPLSLLACAVVVLVTLRRGPREGMFVLVVAAALCGLWLFLLLGDPWPALGVALVLWLPLWGLAFWLRISRSLSTTLAAAALIGVVVVLLFIAMYPDPVAQWKLWLQPLMQSLGEPQPGQDSQQGELFQVFAEWMTGIVATALVLQMVVTLLLARWWQAILYNPGGFRKEFHQLRLPRWLAASALAMLLLTFLDTKIVGWIPGYLAMVLLSVLMFQGLAMTHAILAGLQAKKGWLIGVYGLLLFPITTPHVAVMLGATGMVDAWFDFRASYQGQPPRSGNGDH